MLSKLGSRSWRNVVRNVGRSQPQISDPTAAGRGNSGYAVGQILQGLPLCKTAPCELDLYRQAPDHNFTQTLIDFQTVSSTRRSSKQSSLQIPRHLKRVITLPCEIFGIALTNSENGRFLCRLKSKGKGRVNSYITLLT